MVLKLEGRQKYHSRFELIRTDESLEELKTNLLKKVKVMRFIDFMDQYKKPLEAFPHIALINESFDKCLDDFDVFFFR